MNWTLVWLDGAIGQLAGATAAAWGTPVSGAILRAMARVEVRLETDPANTGESRAGHERVMFEPPLTVEFEVHDEQRAVIVTHVRHTPAR